MEENKKIITVSCVAAAVVTGMVIDVLFIALGDIFGIVAQMRSTDAIKHGLPVAVGVITFITLQFNKNIQVWADEVVIELRKVVWPTKKDTTAMTTVCCIMLIISGVVLGTFDFVSSQLIKMFIN